MTTDEFYEAVGALIQVEHTGVAFPYRKRTRWNNRNAGRGRYVGAGILRVHSPTSILINLRRPFVSGYYNSFERALGAIKEAKDRDEQRLLHPNI